MKLNICKNLCFYTWCVCTCVYTCVFECGHMLYDAHVEARGDSQVPVPAFLSYLKKKSLFH